MRTIIRDNYDPTPNEYHETIVVDEAREKRWLFDCDGVYHDITKVNVVSERGDSEEYAASQKWVTDEVEALEAADQALQDNIDAEEAARIAADETLQDNIDAEEADRIAADTEIWDEIEAIEAASDVVDIVGTYAELQQYDTSALKDNDIIKVLADETHDDAIAYYRWSTSAETFSFVGVEGPYYTASETDALLATKQDKLIAGTNIQIAADGKTISATDTTYSDFTGATTSTAGAHGLVPAPAAGDENKVLKGDGTWGDASESVLLYINHISDLLEYDDPRKHPHIYSDRARQHALDEEELEEIVLNVANDKAPKEVWIMETNSTDSVYKVIGGYYDDMSSGFIISGLDQDVSEEKAIFYRISNIPGESDDTKFKAVVANPTAPSDSMKVYLQRYTSAGQSGYKMFTDSSYTAPLSVKDAYDAIRDGKNLWVVETNRAYEITRTYRSNGSSSGTYNYYFFSPFGAAANISGDRESITQLQSYPAGGVDGTSNIVTMSVPQLYTAGQGITISQGVISADATVAGCTTNYSPYGEYGLWDYDMPQSNSDFFSIYDGGHGCTQWSGQDLYAYYWNKAGAVSIYGVDSVCNIEDVYASAVIIHAERVDNGGTPSRYYFWALVKTKDDGQGNTKEVIRKFYADSQEAMLEDPYHFIVESETPIGGTTYTAGSHISISNGVISATNIPNLYATTGQNTDGAVTQKLFTDTVGDIETALQILNSGAGVP